MTALPGAAGSGCTSRHRNQEPQSGGAGKANLPSACPRWVWVGTPGPGFTPLWIFGWRNRGQKGAGGSVGMLRTAATQSRQDSWERVPDPGQCSVDLARLRAVPLGAERTQGPGKLQAHAYPFPRGQSERTCPQALAGLVKLGGFPLRGSP
ncbi:hypothetical protein P7K49_022658 [Saguinus oedipus]|uniref:Uncharacterized protein n=1 Tax=Saguinus oedipus TaxID=9490 RepID=A0ABQ9ULR7_SAGOE|nr:hypothetical protein P7K49_022658 [Saguinus oedipus]